ncbi:TPA: FtsX-like permease family protein [Candidatus Poribacteria bacterium]|nr:FtsX-like permease family protein [Candidatus Poribacteria bacterium]
MAYLWREAFINIKHSGIVGVLSIIIVALTTMLFSILLIITNHISTQLSILKSSPFITAFLEDDLDDSQREQIQKKIQSLYEVNTVRYVSKEEAFQRTREMFGEHRDILDGLKDMNPLPSSFEIELKGQYLGKIGEVADRIKTFAGVSAVRHAEEAGSFIKGTEMIIWLMVGIMGLASIIIIFFSITITTYMRRDEIKIMRLIGSSRAFIRIPLLLQGLIEGFLGSVLGVSIIYGLFYLYGVLNLMVLDINLETFLSYEQMAVIVGTGMFLGFMGGALPLRKFIKI